MSAQVGVEPTHDDRHRGVRARGSKEQCAIVDCGAEVGDEEDDETYHGDEDAGYGEDEAVGEIVGEGGDGHGEDKGGSPGGCGEEVCFYGGVA